MRLKKIPLLLVCWLFIYSAQAWSFDFADQAAIVESYLTTEAEDRTLAEAMAGQARDAAAGNANNLGGLAKLWCGSVAIAPSPENLAECAHFRFKAVDQMSNPQPSVEAVRMQRARESLTLIRAALEIAGGDPVVSDALRRRLVNDAACFRALIAGTGESGDCNKAG